MMRQESAKTKRTGHWRVPLEGSVLAAIGAFALHCNALLGIDQALVDADGGTSVAAGGDADAALDNPEGTVDTADRAADPACQDLDTTRCNICLAQNCCAETQACRADPLCKYSLESYNGCVLQPGGTTQNCTDNWLAKETNGVELAKCITRACEAVCTNEPLGNICTTYCGCMEDTCCPNGDCGTRIKDEDKAAQVGTNCVAFCSTFTMDQRSCRSYHCGQLARNPANTDDQKTTHCGHAVGLGTACP